MILILIIDYLPRKKFLVWSFMGMAVLTAATGASFLKTYRTSDFRVTLALFVLCQLFFNLGPNKVTFIIPAEIFPTPIRCTCHGISAAAGKLGSIIIQVILLYGKLNVNDPKNSWGLGKVLLIFSVLMALGGVVAWLWLPTVQEHARTKGLKLPSKTLEELAEGRRGVQDRRNGRASSAAEERPRRHFLRRRRRERDY